MFYEREFVDKGTKQRIRESESQPWREETHAINGSLGFGERSFDFVLICKTKGFECIIGSHALVFVRISFQMKLLRTLLQKFHSAVDFTWGSPGLDGH